MINADMLSVAAKGEREIVMTRGFDAPRHLVFRAWTEPALVTRWLGVRGGWTLQVCEIDLRVGGAYRYVWRHAGRGADMGMGGVFREIVVPERIVTTELFDDPWYPGGSIVTTTFDADGGRTVMRMTILYDTVEARDIVLRSPMEEGVADSFDTLAGLLKTLAE